MQQYFGCQLSVFHVIYEYHTVRVRVEYVLLMWYKATPSESGDLYDIITECGVV